MEDELHEHEEPIEEVDDDLELDELALEEKKKKDLLDEDTESLEDLEDEELGDEEEPFDDVDEQ